MQRKVSIITPLFNRLDLVPQTWTSIQAQTNTNWEWIVVDDGSTDGGDTYIKELSLVDSRVQLHCRKDEPKGPSRCRNLGVEKANGEYLLFLDSDDIISSTCLEKRVKHLQQHLDLDFAVFTQEVFENTPGDKDLIFNTFFKNKELYLEAFIADQHPWQTSGPLWKKGAFLKTRGFREDYTIMEDPELHIRAILMGLRFEVINDEPDFFYRLLPKSPEQEKAFWHNSIIGRMQFFRDLLPTLTLKLHRKALSKGILNLYKTFLLARVGHYRKEQNNFIEWVKKENLLSPIKAVTIKLFILLNNTPILNKVPFLKGGLFKLI